MDTKTPDQVGMGKSYDTMEAMKNYHLSIRRRDGTYKQITGYPMSHAECCVMKSKFSTEAQSRILFQPAHDWKESHDFIGDSDVANGSKRIEFRTCRVCGAEDHDGCGDCDPCLGGRKDQCAMRADPDHGPLGNHEAILIAENNRLKAEKETLMIKLSRMCGNA